MLQGEHEVLIEKFQELENAHFDKLNYYAERELKFNSTVQQQTKLIDFLQLKVVIYFFLLYLISFSFLN